jgi:hypothetical protein
VLWKQPPSLDSINQHKEPAKARTTVTRNDGGSITTNLGYGIAVAKGSSLKREWIAVHYPDLPFDLDATPGVTTVYKEKQYGGEYRYRAEFKVLLKEEIRAIEVKFLAFDVWGDHTRTLSSETVEDMKPGSKILTADWSLYSENDVEKHYASIAWIARARLADGRVVETPTETVVQEARKFSSKFAPGDLEPKPVAPPAVASK